MIRIIWNDCMKIDGLLNIKKDLSVEEQEFLELHNKAYQAATYSSLYGYEFGGILKQLNDSKKYLVAGYETLEEYTSEVYGMGKSQAYKYIKLYETYSPDFFHSSGNLGITKLNMLASLGNETEVKEFIKENNVSEITVKELREKIEKLKNSEVNKDATIVQLRMDIEALQTELGTSEIKEVIKEVTVVDETKIKELEEKLSKSEENNAKLASQIEKLKDSSDKDKIEELNKSLASSNEEKKALQANIETLKKKVSLSSNEDYNKFKAQFNMLQKVIKDTLNMVFDFLDKEFQSKCYIALNKLFEGSIRNDKE